jgi:hypothetical protein
LRPMTAAKSFGSNFSMQPSIARALWLRHPTVRG